MDRAPDIPFRSGLEARERLHVPPGVGLRGRPGDGQVLDVLIAILKHEPDAVPKNHRVGLGEIYRDQYGVSEEDLEFFFMHLEADEEHAGRAIELVRKYCTSEEQLERCKWGVQEVLDATKVLAEGMERVCS